MVWESNCQLRRLHIWEVVFLQQHDGATWPSSTFLFVASGIGDLRIYPSCGWQERQELSSSKCSGAVFLTIPERPILRGGTGHGDGPLPPSPPLS